MFLAVAPRGLTRLFKSLCSCNLLNIRVTENHAQSIFVCQRRRRDPIIHYHYYYLHTNIIIMSYRLMFHIPSSAPSSNHKVSRFFTAVVNCIQNFPFFYASNVFSLSLAVITMDYVIKYSRVPNLLLSWVI